MSDSDSKLVQKLQSSSTSDVYSALIRIRTNYIKNSIKMQRLERYSVIKIIISFLEHPKLCNVALSIIANACMENSLRLRVIKNDGIRPLIRIIKSLANDDIQNRACRALGNIAMCEIGCNAVHEMKPVFHIVRFLTSTEDANCQQTAVRTLRILGNSCKSREIIVEENGILSIAKLLESKHNNVLQCSIKALSVLTQNCSISCARQLLECKCVDILVELYSHSDEQVKENALMSLKNLAYQEEMRSTLVKAGAMQLFAAATSSLQIPKTRKLAALALSACLDHIHMWDGNNMSKIDGLKALIEVLRNDMHKDIRMDIIASFLPLCFEFETIDILLELELVQVLIEILCKFIEANKYRHILPVAHDYTDGIKVELESSFQACNTITPGVDSDHVEALNFSADSFHSEKGDLPTSESLIVELNVKSRTETASKTPEKSLKSMRSLVIQDSGVEFSIKNPNYKYLQNANTPVSMYNYNLSYGSYRGFESPYRHCRLGNNATNCGSPDCICDWNPSSSCTSSSFSSSLSSSPSFEKSPFGWSPTLSSCLSSPVSVNNETEQDFKELENMMPNNMCSLSDRINNTQRSDERCVQPSSNFMVDQDSVMKIALLETIAPKSSSNKTDDYGQISSTKFQDEQNIQCTDKKSVTVEDKYVSDETLKVKFSTKLKTTLPLISVPELKLKIVSQQPREKRLHEMTKDSTSENYSQKITTPEVYSSFSPKKKLKIEATLASTNNIKTSSDISETYEQKSKSPNPKIDHYILQLLSQISSRLQKKTNSVIASKACFGVLMDYLYMVSNPSPKAGKVLIKLVKNRYCFEKLILCGFVNEMEDRIIISHKTESCSRCSKLDDIRQDLLLAGQLEAESDFGIGTLAHILLTTEKDCQLRALYASTKLVTHKTGLYELLINSDGLSVLLTFLTDSDEIVHQHAAASLCFLYCNLAKNGIENHESTKTQLYARSNVAMIASNCSYKDATHDIKFVVKNGVNVPGSRDELCKNSEYFHALLDGHFSEKEQTVISLPTISAEALCTIFHFLHGCREEICQYVQQIPFEVLLELLSECDRFLLFNTKTMVEKRLCGCLHPDTIIRIYQHSKMYNSLILWKKALHFALSINVSEKVILTKCFRNLISLPPHFDFLTDIEVLLKSMLSEYD